MRSYRRLAPIIQSDGPGPRSLMPRLAKAFGTALSQPDFSRQAGDTSTNCPPGLCETRSRQQNLREHEFAPESLAQGYLSRLVVVLFNSFALAGAICHRSFLPSSVPGNVLEQRSRNRRTHCVFRERVSVDILSAQFQTDWVPIGL